MEKLKQIEQKIPFNKEIAKAIGIFMPNWERASVNQGAAEMAYFTLLSILPILLVLANIIPLLPLPVEEILGFIQNIAPDDIYNILAPTLIEYLESGSGGAISLGALAAIWSASKIINSMRNILNDVYNTIGQTNFILGRILSMFIMLGVIIVIGLAIFAFVFGEQILLLVQSLIGIDIPFINQFLAFRWLVLIAILPVVFLILYQFVPDHNLPIKYAVPGAIFSTVGWLILTQFFSIYISLAGGEAAANATFGTFIILMLFLYFSSIILLIGALVNVLVFEWRNDKTVREFEKEKIYQENLEEANWTGYPNESDDVILRNKIYKVKFLDEQEVTEVKEKDIETDKKRSKKVSDEEEEE